VTECGVVLYVMQAKGNHSSQLFNFVPQKQRKISVLCSLSKAPLLSGWYTVVQIFSILNSLQMYLNTPFMKFDP
jgi:hypothetical protein